MKKEKLIFDIGVHDGSDTDFYLNKGFGVVGIEANPKLVRDISSRFANHIKKGSLTLIPRAITNRSDKFITLYVNETKDDWSSTIKNAALKGQEHELIEISCETITLRELIDRFGVPYYLKCDIEEADFEIVEALSNETIKPDFVSFEIYDETMIQKLSEMGYKYFQIRNMLLNFVIPKPDQSFEGANYWPGQMNGYFSGPFGNDLPSDEWLSVEEVTKYFRSYKHVSKFGYLRNSWFDLHAKLRD